jgi:phosphotransferase system, enzyme I, PtsP
MIERGLAVRGPRSLLRQIREALAGGGPAQARLDKVVQIIAFSMVAEARCTCAAPPATWSCSPPRA